MNHVFKIIWNKVNQCWVAVSELSKSVGKSSQTDKRKALNVIIGAAVLAGATTSAMAETNVVVNDKGTVIGGAGAVAYRTNAVVLGNSANSNTADSIAIGTGAKVEGDADYNKYNIALVIKLDQPIEKQLPLVTMQMVGELVVLQLVVVVMHPDVVRQLVMAQKLAA